MESFEISSSQGPYQVRFEAGIASLIASLCDLKNAVLIVDEKVAKIYQIEFATALISLRCFVVFASEEEKTLTGCQKILKFLVDTNTSKETQIIAMGGGIVQDMVTFCAHIYYRGLRWVYVPTTLLAMADSCIGAKASINFAGYKNQLGVFHSPGEVRICVSFLDSLPEDEIRSGYGEMVKLHLVAGLENFRSISNGIRSDGFRGPQLNGFVGESLRIKKEIIEKDEFDRGLRKTLNYGHTFGHALEAVTEHAIPHGLAVAWGIDLINFLAVEQGRMNKSIFAEIHAFLATNFSWHLGKEITVTALMKAAMRDKKIVNGKLTLIMPSLTGPLEIVEQARVDHLPQQIGEYLNTFSIVKP